MVALSLDSVRPGMEVFDAAGTRVGTVAYTYHQLELGVAFGEPPGRVPMIEVQAVAFLGLGRHFHLPLAAVGEVDPGCVFLTLALAPASFAEQRSLLTGGPHL